MKLTLEIDSKKVLVISVVLIILLLTTAAFAQRRTDQARASADVEKPGIAGQFAGSFTCMVTQCGWPAIVLLVLPALAVYVWKKVFSWG